MLDQSYYRKSRRDYRALRTRKQSSLIPIMQDIQAEYRYLPGRAADVCGQGDRCEGSESVQRRLRFMRTFPLSRRASM